VLQANNISKSFGGVPVLRDVCFDVRAGEVHALAGANGAGKSTLVNIISGVLQRDSGVILWDGKRVELNGPRNGRDLGISFVHQELALVPQLSVGENIFLGRHPLRHGLVAWDQIYKRARELLAALGHYLDPAFPAGDLGIAEQQLVEIARALAFDARLIIMDEPTAALSGTETSRLFRTIAELRARGVSTVYITHRLQEIFEVADRVTVLRDGALVRTVATSAISTGDLVRDMIGNKEDPSSRRAVARSGEAIIRVERLTKAGAFEDVTFGVGAGEVVGPCAERRVRAVQRGGSPVFDEARRRHRCLVRDEPAQQARTPERIVGGRVEYDIAQRRRPQHAAGSCGRIRRRRRQAEGGVDQHQFAHPLRVLQGEFQRRPTAEGMAYHRGLVHVPAIEHGGDPARLRRPRKVDIDALVGITEGWQVDRDHAPAGGLQRGHQFEPGTAPGRGAMDQQDRLAGRRTEILGKHVHAAHLDEASTRRRGGRGILGLVPMHPGDAARHVKHQEQEADEQGAR